MYTNGTTIGRNEVIAANSTMTSSEVFGEETVVIHFERGTYFSLRGSAVQIWSLLQQAPTSIAEIAAAAHAQPGPPADFETSLTRIVAQLTEHDLVIKCSGTALRPNLSPEIQRRLAAPADLEVYSDLTELIAMDPVHEIDTLTGWPHRPQLEK